MQSGQCSTPPSIAVARHLAIQTSSCPSNTTRTFARNIAAILIPTSVTPVETLENQNGRKTSSKYI